MTVVLLQVIFALVIAVLSGVTYLGLQEQKVRAERQAAEIAKGVVWIPVLKEDEAGFGGEAVTEKMRAEEKRQLQQAIALSSKDACHAAASLALSRTQLKKGPCRTSRVYLQHAQVPRLV